jgi:hypothetical protein
MATTVTLKPNAIDISGSTSGTTTLQATAVAGTTTLTLPAATDTLVGKATTDTLTNKTLTGAVMNGTLGATTPSTGAFTTVQIGTNPAGVSIGVLGIPNQKRLYGRNAANSADVNILYVDGSNGLVLGPSDAAVIDSSGNLLVGTTSGTKHFLKKDNSNNEVVQVENSASTTPYGQIIYFSAAAPNDATRYFLTCQDTGATRATIRSNGGLANFSANNVNLSDERTKTDIQNAGGYLAKICAIPVRTFKYKDQTDDLLNLGVIAQEVETVAPELVDTTGFGETPDDGIPLKAIYQTDLQYALMKCIQEQQALITQLTARITALESA